MQSFFCLPLRDSCITFKSDDLEDVLEVARCYRVKFAGKCTCGGRMIPVFVNDGQGRRYQQICDRCHEVQDVPKKSWRKRINAA